MYNNIFKLLTLFLTINISLFASQTEWTEPYATTGLTSTGLEYDLKFDRNGVPYVLHGGSSNTLKLYKYDTSSSSWSQVGATISSTYWDDPFLEFDTSGTTSDLSLSPSGIPYVSFRDSSNSWKVSVKKYENGSWSYVGSAGFSSSTMFETRISRVDENGDFYVSHDTQDDQLYVYKYTESSNTWAQIGGNVATGTSSGTNNDKVYYIVDIEISPSGLVYAAYQDKEVTKKISVRVYDSENDEWDTASSVQTTLRALTFTPTENRVAPASTETTTFTLTANDGSSDSTANTGTTVVSTSINDTPTDISLSNSTISVQGYGNEFVGDLNSTDVDTNDSYTYSLVSGTGDTDNASFDISGTQLLAKTPSSLTSGDTYSIRVQTNDGDATYEKSFTITANNDTVTIEVVEPSLQDTDSAYDASTNKYVVSSPRHLSYISQNTSMWDKSYIQTADIDLSATQYWDDAEESSDSDKYNDTNDGTSTGNNEGWSPIGNSSTKFTGSYDGGGYAISGLYIDRSSSYQGFFGQISGATITDLNISTQGTITTGAFSGILVGYSVTSTSTIDNCHVSGAISGTYNLGGAIGYSQVASTITNSSSSADVNGSAYNIGGFIGESSANISYSYSTGDVATSYSSSYNANYGIGGFAGKVNSGTISNNYARGSATGSATLFGGGFVGVVSSGTISKNYAASSALSPSSSMMKGFAGTGTTDADNFWDETTSGQSTGGGSAIGKSTNEMKSISTYLESSWDFVVETTNGTDSIWDTDTSDTINDGYPYFDYQSASGLSSSDFLSGSGTSGDPYLIDTAAKLDMIRAYNGSDVYFKLTANIDLNGTIYNDESGDGWNPFGSTSSDGFKSHIDGNGYTISNLNMATSGSYSGLIGYMDDGSISNLTISTLGTVQTGANYIGVLVAFLELNNKSIDINNTHSSGDINITTNASGKGFTGGLIGYYDLNHVNTGGEGNVSNSSSSVNITGITISSVGGFIGAVAAKSGQTLDIDNSYATGNVTLSQLSGSSVAIVGGFIGDIDNTQAPTINITNSYATGDVTSKFTRMGGFIGSTDTTGGTTITKCSATGDVYSQTTLGTNLGGFIGSSSATISCSYATGSVTVSQTAAIQTNQGSGGFVGYMTRGSITNSFASGDINASASDAYIGGFAGTIGAASAGTITNSYSKGLVTGTSDSYNRGFVGYITNGTVNNTNFWDTNTSGKTADYSSSDAVGKTTTEMQTLSTFTDASWDFSEGACWSKSDDGSTAKNSGYPYPASMTFAPNIDSVSLASDNSYIDVTLQAGAYANSNGSGAVTTDDFTLTFTQNSGGATGVTLDSITQTNGSALAGGEETIRFNISITGNATAVETIAITPASSSSVYNISGSAASTTQTNNSVTLNDGTAPTITNVTIPNSAMKVGDSVTATITVISDADDYTSGSGEVNGTIGGFSLGSLSKTNDTTYTATFTVSNGGTDVASGSDIDLNVTISDSTGNQSDAYTTAISQSSDSIDANKPTLTSVTIVSNNDNNTSLAKVGDTITLSFTASETLASTPTVTIATQSATVTNSSGNSYSATYTMTSSESAGTVPFTIDFSDSASNSGVQVTAVTSGDDITFDKTAPSGYSVNITTDPITNSNKTAAAFQFTSAEVNATYNYSIDDTNSSTSAVTGNGTVSTTTDTISNIDVSSLDDDTLTLTVYLTDAAGNQGSDATDTVTKDADSGMNAISDLAASGSGSVTTDNYDNAGISDVNSTNLSAINDAIANKSSTDVDTIAEIQDIVDSYNKIIDYTTSTATDPNATDYSNIGITDIDTDEEVSELNTLINAQTGISDVDTIAEVQALADEIIAINIIEDYADDNTSPTPTVANYENAGVDGVYEFSLSSINSC